MTETNKKKKKARIALLHVFSAIYLYFLFLELFLWLPSLYIKAENALKKSSDNPEINILVLGESTSADESASFDSWPRILEERLLRLGYSAKVINKAKSGTTTGVLRLESQRLLKEQNIDIVISMMGINDTAGLFITEKPKHLYERLRIFKLVKVLSMSSEEKKRWFGVNHNEINQNNELTTQTEKVINEVAETLLNNIEFNISDVKKNYAIQNEFKTQNPLVLAKAIELLSGKSKNWSVTLYKILIEKYPKKASIYPHPIQMAFFERKRSFCEFIAAKVLHYKVPLDLDAQRNLIFCLPLNAKDTIRKLENFFGIRSLKIKNFKYSETVANYRYLAKVLREQGIIHIAMQYPLLPVEKLISYFEAQKHQPDFYVENKKNFLDAVREKGFKNVFVDNFAITFGHTTLLGNQLIVENLLQTTIQAIKKSKLAQKNRQP